MKQFSDIFDDKIAGITSGVGYPGMSATAAALLTEWIYRVPNHTPSCFASTRVLLPGKASEACSFRNSGIPL